MTVLAFVLGAALTVIAALHVYWGIGGVWPGTDPKSCARAVAGFKDIDAMPSPFACFAVAAVAGAAALIVLALGGVFASPFDPMPLAGAALFIALALLFRGVLGFTPFWRRLTPEMPFAKYDLRYYSPLCLALGAGIAILAFEGFAA